MRVHRCEVAPPSYRPVRSSEEAVHRVGGDRIINIEKRYPRFVVGVGGMGGVEM